MAVAALALVAGCTGGNDATPDAAPSGVAAPTGPRVDLEQTEGAKGEDVSLGTDLAVVVAAGSTSSPVTSSAKDSERVLYRMPDATAAGVPALQVSWGRTRPRERSSRRGRTRPR